MSFTSFNGYSRLTDTVKDYQLTEDLVWDIDFKGSAYQLTVPSGFAFQVSSPKLLDRVFKKLPHHKWVLLPSIVHDKLLECGHSPIFSSHEFARASRAMGAWFWVSWILFGVTWVWTKFTQIKSDT